MTIIIERGKDYGETDNAYHSKKIHTNFATQLRLLVVTQIIFAPFLIVYMLPMELMPFLSWGQSSGLGMNHMYIIYPTGINEMH